MKKILNKTSILFVAATVALILMTTLVNPENSSVLFIFIPIVLTWIVGVCALKTIISVTKLKNSNLWSIIVYILVSFLIVIMLLSGLGQLTAQDVIITVLLATLVTFYIHRLYS